MSNPTTTWRQRYLDKGWVPIAVKSNSKQPANSGWQHTTNEEAPDIPEGMNIGLVLGRGLVDIDLDCSETRLLAGNGFLPPTLTSGRETSSQSHYWYEVAEATEYLQFVDPMRAQLGDAEERKKAMLLEVRATTNQQTLVEPSIHSETGEPYEWDDWEVPVTQKDWATLKAMATVTAVTALLGRYWPREEGGRHTLSLALAGTLCRYDIIRAHPKALYFPIVRGVCALAGDDEVEDRVTAAATTLDKWGSGSNLFGLPKLLDGYGSNRLAVSKAIEWLDSVFDTDVEEEDTDDDYVHLLWTPDRLLTEEFPPIEFALQDHLVKNMVTTLLGEKGVGKSLLSLWWAKMMAEEGKTVILYDEENFPAIMQERYRAMGITSDHDIRYMPTPHLNWQDDTSFRNLLRTLERSQADVLMVDSIVDIIGEAGLSLNDNAEMSSLYRKRINILPQVGDGVTVLLHDHKPTSGEAKAKGVGEKGDIVQFEWDVTLSGNRAFSKTTSGALNLRVIKDRAGMLGGMGSSRRWNVTPTPGGGIHIEEDTAMNDIMTLMGATSNGSTPSAPPLGG